MKIWTKDQICTLRSLHGAGYSFSQISAKIGGGITKNACISKAHRINLPLRAPMIKPRPKPNPASTPALPKRKRSIVQSIKARQERTVETLPLPEPAISAEEFDRAIPANQRVTIIGLTADTCRFPLWSDDNVGGDRFYCGGVPIPGFPWCYEHARRCWVPNPRRSV